MALRVNLSFHGIGKPDRKLEDAEHLYWISSDFLHQILDYAASKETVGLSFDDGNASDVEIALPALCERELRAEFFPVGGRIGQPGSVDHAGLRELVRHGMSIGSHGMRHRSWRGLDSASLDEELVEARRLIAAEAGAAVNVAACPLGSYDRRVLGRLRKLGYSRVLTSDRNVARESAWLQPRHSVRSGDSFADVRALVERRHTAVSRLASATRIAVKRLR